MSAHTYDVQIRWSRGDAAFTDNRYSRAHSWHFDGGIEVPASSSPYVVRLPLSSAAAVDPEEAFVASISSCHMLWFLSLAAGSGFRVDRYVDGAVGVMGKKRGWQNRRDSRDAASAGYVLGGETSVPDGNRRAASQSPRRMLHCELGDDRHTLRARLRHPSDIMTSEPLRVVTFRGGVSCRRDTNGPLGLTLIGWTADHPDERASVSFSGNAPENLPEVLEDPTVFRIDERHFRILSARGIGSSKRRPSTFIERSRRRFTARFRREYRLGANASSFEWCSR